ncbi:hypothetical protein B0A56_00815 [Flavobacterium columnare NBRC 100251 = ATCC 23463]|nr:hypothetical protein B0A56_00815 [Flavobacterium columnare NBRC 100251 = ATCC 23463]
MATTRQLQTLFTKLGYNNEQRAERINAWTAGRTRSTKELEADELTELCQSLTAQVRQQKQIFEDAKRQRRSAILTIATRTGIKHPNCWDTFNHFMLHKSCARKALRLCNLDELEQVLLQFRALEHSNAISAQKPGTKAYYNKLGMHKPSEN